MPFTVPTTSFVDVDAFEFCPALALSAENKPPKNDMPRRFLPMRRGTADAVPEIDLGILPLPPIKLLNATVADNMLIAHSKSILMEEDIVIFNKPSRPMQRITMVLY